MEDPDEEIPSLEQQLAAGFTVEWTRPFLRRQIIERVFSGKVMDELEDMADLFLEETSNNQRPSHPWFYFVVFIDYRPNGNATNPTVQHLKVLGHGAEHQDELGQSWRYDSPPNARVEFFISQGEPPWARRSQVEAFVDSLAAVSLGRTWRISQEELEAEGCKVMERRVFMSDFLPSVRELFVALVTISRQKAEEQARGNNQGPVEGETAGRLYPRSRGALTM